jgi:hypothetical protein
MVAVALGIVAFFAGPFFKWYNIFIPLLSGRNCGFVPEMDSVLISGICTPQGGRRALLVKNLPMRTGRRKSTKRSRAELGSIISRRRQFHFCSTATVYSDCSQNCHRQMCSFWFGSILCHFIAIYFSHSLQIGNDLLYITPWGNKCFIAHRAVNQIMKKKN